MGITIQGGNITTLSDPCSIFAFRQMVASFSGTWQDWIASIRVTFFEDMATSTITTVAVDQLGNTETTWNEFHDEGYACEAYSSLQTPPARRLVAASSWLLGVRINGTFCVWQSYWYICSFFISC
jgi:hypothetical protein